MKKLLKQGLPILVAICMLFALSGCSVKDTTPVNAQEGNASIAKEIKQPVTEAIDTEGKLVVNYLDVGQGDSIFIELPNGQTMLIDAGEKENSGNIINFIRKKGYTKLDYVMGTHPHSDHIGAMEEVIRAFEVGKIYMPMVEHTSKTFENLMDAIEEKGIAIKTAKADVTILSEDNGLELKLVAPVSDNYKDLNNYSAVMLLTYGENTFLFTGDAETLVEKEIQGDIHAQVLKSGHHGSDTSSSQEFLDRVQPEYAVISVGEGNSYGHPVQEILQRYKTMGIQILRTDLLGTITFISNGKDLIYTVEKAENAEPVSDANTPQESADTDKESKISPADETNASKIVYITKTGKKYHAEGCASLSDSAIETTLEEAIAQGLEPCSKCKPGE